MIYSLALHRLLKQRLKGKYEYQRDFGGVIYLFLRGVNIKQDDTQEASINNETPSGVYFVKPPEALILSLDEEVGKL